MNNRETTGIAEIRFTKKSGCYDIKTIPIFQSDESSPYQFIIILQDQKNQNLLSYDGFPIPYQNHVKSLKKRMEKFFHYQTICIKSSRMK